MAELGLEIEGKVRAKKFIAEAMETKQVYYLKRGQYAEQSESNDFQDEGENPLPIIPFWSETYLPYARKWGEGLEIQELSLESFIRNWLHGMNEDGVVVGLNWDQNGIGYECAPLSLLEDMLKSELEDE